MTTSTMTAIAGLAAITLTAGTFAQTTAPSPSTPRTSPSTPARSTPSTPARTTPSTPQQTTPGTSPATGTPATTPTQTTPTQTNPSNTIPGTNIPEAPADQPNFNPSLPPVTNDPNVVPQDQLNPNVQQPVIVGPNGQVIGPAGVFSVDPGQEARFQQLSQRLATLEQQLSQSNERLLQSLGEARAVADTNTKLDRLANVIQQSLLQNRLMLQFLSETRAAMTGATTNRSPNDNRTAPTTTTTPTGAVRPAPRTQPGSIAPNTTSPRSPTVAPGTPSVPSQPVQPSGGPR